MADVILQEVFDISETNDIALFSAEPAQTEDHKDGHDAANDHAEDHDHSDGHEHAEDQADSHDAGGHEDAEDQADGHDAGGQEDGGEMTADQVFPTLLGNLGDHRKLSWLGYHICELPVIVYDNKEGLHVYSSTSAMNEEGTFVMHHHPPIKRASDEAAVTLDMSITSLLVFQFIGVAILLTMFFFAGRKAKKNPGKAPSGVQNLVETVVVFIRDEIVKPNVPTKRASKGLLPYFVTLFFFILILNLLGLLPGGHSATGSLSVCAALAIIAYFVVNITAIREAGIGAWFKHLLGGAPWWLSWLMIPIEIAAMFIKPFALTIRLFANMTAGHVVIFSLLGLVFYFKISLGLGAGLGISVVTVLFSVFVYCLELLVAFLQAYIFSMLVAVFIGLAIGDHAHEEEHAH
ncbi:MAG: F0F1 ATP synthase subunit A [Candidatus Kapabacteria bacterium]|jgi:F-type H+-transporting ATPase subunit a|nr:F0F1 ATP synthase subunit A [Candidatus Kapabacteria bacterium]